MTDSGQTDLGGFGDTGDESVESDRDAAAEARAVAGPGQDTDRVVDPDREAVPEATGTVEMAVTQVDYTVVGSGRDERPIVHVFGRTADREREHVKVLGFRPYFYAPTATLSDEKLDHDRITGWEETDEDGEPYESIRGEHLTKIFARTPRDVGQMRDEFDHYEADILFPNRLLIDKDIRGAVHVPERRDDDGTILVPHEEVRGGDVSVAPRVLTLDIEVDDRRGFPEDGEEPIVCMTTHDSYDDEYVLWLYEAPDWDGSTGVDDAARGTVTDGGAASTNGRAGDDSEPDADLDPRLADYEPIRGEIDVDVRTFEEEAAMLDALAMYVERKGQDVMTGWNFEDFDMPYLLDRMEELDGRAGVDRDLSVERLSRIDEVWRSGWGGPDVKGRVVFDLLYAYKRTQFTELESYRLDAVGEMDNLRDVELCVEIDREQDVIPFWMEVASFVGCLLEDAPTPGDAVDLYVLHEAHGEFALPSKGRQESEEFEGGAVFDPISGVRENVSVLDLKCFSGDTDVLTPDGVRNVRELEVGDPIYTLDPETFECEVKPVAETHEYHNRYGELHHLSGNTHDLKITENHRLLVSKERGWDDRTPDDFEFSEYRNVPETERFAFPTHEPMDGAVRDEFRLYEHVEGGHAVVYAHDGLTALRAAVPAGIESELDWANGTSRLAATEEKTGKYLVPIETYRQHREQIEAQADEVFLKYDRGHAETPLSFDTDDWLELVGWFVTEGSYVRESPGIVLHQQDEDGRAAIRDLLERTGLNHSSDDDRFQISNRFLHDWFQQHCGDGHAEKHLPEWVFELDAGHLRGLLETLVDGDGSRADSGLRKFWTRSDRLKRDVARLAVRCGEKPTVSKQGDGTWYVSIGKRGSFNRSVNATMEEHDETVHCVTAEDNHVVLAGRNGQFQWVGQSLYPMSMVTINASPETRVGEEYDDPTYRAPNGQRFREEPDGMIRTMVDELLEEREVKKDARDDYEPNSERYERYDRQQAAVKVIMNCFTPDTDVLTPDGVRNVRDLEVGDEVYSLDPDTMEMELKPVEETHEYPDYRGELIDIETGKIDLRVTPNHRMLVRKAETNGIAWDEDEYRFVEAGDLDDATNYQLPHGWDGPDGTELDRVDLTELLDGEYEVWANNDVHGHTLAAEVGQYPDKVVRQAVDDTGYVFSAEEFAANREYLDEDCSEFYVHGERGRKWIPRCYDGDDFLELLAWYITEGNVHTSTEKQFGDNFRGSSTTINIAQEAIPDGGQGDDHAAIGELLERMGFEPYSDQRGYQFTSKLLGEWLEGNCGADSFEKRIPEFVFDLTRRQKRHFLETLIAGDGDRQRNSWRYSTASEELRDDVLRLCVHLGLTANYGEDSDVYRIHVTEDTKNTLRMHRSAGRSTAEDGVYCVTVADNHTLLAGRNGTFQFVGQSLYGVLGWDRFRLYDKDMGAAVTATGRSVIDFTEEVSSEMGYQVTYGDSVTGDRPVMVRDPGDRVQITPIESLYEQVATDTEPDLLITADGGAVAKTTVGKERATPDGWEALSMNERGEAEWQPIEEVIRHETDKEVVNLQHEFGESTTTTDHSFVVSDDGGFTEASPKEVDEPLRIPGVPAVETAEAVDLYEVLNGYTREYGDGRSVGSENAETKVKRVHTDGERVWFGHEHHHDLDETVTLRRHVDLDGEDGVSLVRLLAAYAAEGSASTIETTDSKFGASIASSDREWLETLQEDYHRLFDGAIASITASDADDERRLEDGEDGETTYEDTTEKLQMMNELSAVFFREFAGQTSRGKQVPSLVYHLSDDLQRLFVETLVEGDGSRKFRRYTGEDSERNFDYETASRELAAGLSMLLTQRDRKHSLKYRDEKERYTIRTCDYYRSERDLVIREVVHDGYVYDLSVAENENFVDAVGGIVLHNTDSVMLELGPDVSKEEAIEQSFEIEERINESYDEFASGQLNAETHRFEIEFEKLYRRFFQAGKKKRYAGHTVWKEGNDVDDIDITGFEYKRSDIAPVTKKVQQEVIQKIVHGGDREAVKEYVAGVVDDFQAGEMDLDDVGIPGGIGKRLDAYETDTAQVRGAKYANLLLGTNFGRGSKPKRVYLEKNGVHPDYFQRIDEDVQGDAWYDDFREDVSEGNGVVCFEYSDQVPEEFQVDWEKMLTKTLKKPISPLIEAIGLSWDEVVNDHDQSGLGDFM
ncbi:hypothetical protein BRD13_01740 [Halobacteriales archaeon SW_5_70_135]|nr:MAG: hypothetical protein BRD13_01740 [Halobacteriales archaeon SW_5_70_135]